MNNKNKNYSIRTKISRLAVKKSSTPVASKYCGLQIGDMTVIIFLRNKILVRKVPGISEGTLLELNEKMAVHISYEYEIMNSDLDDNFRPQRKTRQPFYKIGTVVTEPMYGCEEEKTSTDQPIPEIGVVFY